MSARAMKDSGVPWIGEIPVGWTVWRFKRLALVRNGQVDPRDQRFRERPLFAPNHIESATGRLLDVTSAEDQGAESGKYLVTRGDVLYSKIRPALAKVCIAPYDGLCSADMYAIHPRPGVEPRFVMWSMLERGFTHAATLESERVAMPKINRECLAELEMVAPPLEEQRRIAAFLDARTAAIDAALDTHEATLTLLSERRQSLVSHAVTRGLDPSAPTHDSGVAAIGEIPRHWVCTDLRRLCDPSRPITYGIVLPGENVLRGVFIIKSGDCTAERLRPELLHRTTFEIAEKYKRSQMKGGDLVIAIRGTVGQVALVPLSLDGANLTQDTARIAPIPGVDRGWLLMTMQSAAIQNEIAERTVGATVRGLNLRELRRLTIPLPPLDEQRAIVAHLRERTATLDAAADTARRAIELLREYRQSLVTAAVTGRVAPEAMGS